MPETNDPGDTVKVRKNSMPSTWRRYRPRIFLARNLRRLWWHGKLIAVTGSSGKTTATALTGAMLSTAMRTETQARRNIMSALSRRVITFKPWRSDALVVEAGIFSPSDMRVMADMLRPDIAIVTVVGLEHVSSFRTREDVAKEKGELVAAVPRDGIAILNGDDPHVRGMAARCRGKVLFFGSAEDAALRLHASRYRWPDGLSLDLSWKGEPFTAHCPVVGTHWVPSILGSLAAALALGVDRGSCLDVLAAFEPVFNRMSVHPTPAGRTFILDCYKGAHWQIAATTDFLKNVNAPRKTVVFGSLSDRWGATRSRYYESARAASLHADRVIFAGPTATYVRRMLDRPEGAKLEMIPAIPQAIRRIAEDVVPGEVIYLKSAEVTKLECLMYPDFLSGSLKERCELAMSEPPPLEAIAAQSGSPLQPDR